MINISNIVFNNSALIVFPCLNLDSSASKDLILMIISLIGAQGARGALIAPDEKAIEYVFARASDMTEEQRKDALNYWATLRSDKDAEFEIEYTFDTQEVVPYVTWGASPDQAPITGKVPAAEGPQSGSLQKAMDYTGLAEGTELEGLAVQHVFIGSWTIGRIEDLREVAAVAKGQKVSPSVSAMVVPGSGVVRDQAESEGIALILIDAEFEWRKPGCSMCLAMNDDVLEFGIRCASSTNRNFEGRQGRGAITHLMSSAMAATAAAAGHITDGRTLGDSND